MSYANNSDPSPGRASISPISSTVETFRQQVIDRIQITIDGHSHSYQEYIALPVDKRRGDEANAVDLRFTRAVLEWLGFDTADLVYNQSQSGKKANRPDYVVKGLVGEAFIWEDKSSAVDLDEKEHLLQMRRYSLGTAGYAIWCNMRRLFAVRFSPDETLKYDILTDISIEELFGLQTTLATNAKTQATSLALFQLLFGKERFTQFSELIAKIARNEQQFVDQATAFETTQAIRAFINGSREALEHLRLAALARLLEALERRDMLLKAEADIRKNWNVARDDFVSKITFGRSGLDAMSRRVLEEIEQLTPRLGELEPHELRNVQKAVERAMGVSRLSSSLVAAFTSWLERALRANSALLSLHFATNDPFRIAEAYRVWSERQSDREDIRPEIFAEQVAYVFFVRLLLIRVLEDKAILQPRIASDGGFLDWSSYIQRHFQELDGIGILNENYCNILARKAGQYYVHFFEQAVFSWFSPDDFLLIETLEFLCRYNFKNISSDIIGFTYEEYIDRNARNRKGHFLTRQDVVEYMLDLLEYSGPQIIGRRILDPACGSGSFLVHAARRYRRALVTYFCNVHGILSEEQLYAQKDVRVELARRYLDDMTSLFYGTELNPFACYLSEMNLLIQVLDDLSTLQQAGDKVSVERFHIYNTDSLDIPYEILSSPEIGGVTQRILVPDRITYRLTDEAYPIKAKLDHYAEGFFYIISNPPYVNSRQEEMDVERFKHVPFYRAVLTGDTNLYLLFLRLGLYYLGDYGQMIYIVPLTIFGDKSASAARKLLKTEPFSPDVVTRFYRGDILFPGVDQAVGIVRVRRLLPNASITVSGGNTVQDVRIAPFTTNLANVVDAVPQNGVWQGNWLVAPNQISLDIWQHVKRVSDNLTFHLGSLLDEVFDIRQGDVNATLLNPLRLGVNKGSFTQGHIAIYKGEDVGCYAPLPSVPSDWARTLSADTTDSIISEVQHASEILTQLKHMKGSEYGIVLRQVARLNTREHLIASWFERTSTQPLAFTNELWRMVMLPEAAEQAAKAVLALLNSKVVAYLVNLFSTNNHVSKDEIGRLPVPDPQMLPVNQLAVLANALLQERASLQKDIVEKYHVVLPRFADGSVYVPPSAVLAQATVPKLTMLALVGRGEVKNTGPANGRIKALRGRNAILSTLEPNNPNAGAFKELLTLFLQEPERENETWSQAQQWLLPDPVAAQAWLNIYNAVCQQAQARWNAFVALQQQVDEAVADWYGFDAPMRAAIAEGLPWARRQRNA